MAKSRAPNPPAPAPHPDPAADRLLAAIRDDFDALSRQLKLIARYVEQHRDHIGLDRIQDVFAEIPRVREDLGFPPLVTPTSQIVGTQAVFNVMMGRYKAMSGEFADLMLGYYGQPLGERDPEVVALAEAQTHKTPITCRPADLLHPEWQDLRQKAIELPGNNGSDEDVLTYAMFPQVAPKFFSTRDQGPKNLGKDPGTQAVTSAAAAGGSTPVNTPVTYDVRLNGRSHRVSVTPL